MIDREQRLTTSWTANADAWTAVVRAGGIESRRLVTDQAVLEAVQRTKARRILDVGCGEGWLARRLAESGAEVVGFDGSTPLIEKAQAAGSAQYHTVSYEQFIDDPARVGTGFDTAVCNFALLNDAVTPLLAALKQVAHQLVIQTVHPFSTLGDHPYVDGWREETFDAMPGSWMSMPWYYRTIGSWLRELSAAGWQLLHIDEPLHPISRKPASLILSAR